MEERIESGLLLLGFIGRCGDFLGGGFFRAASFAALFGLAAGLFAFGVAFFLVGAGFVTAGETE